VEGWWQRHSSPRLRRLFAGRGATADTPESPIVEVERWLPAPAGGMKRVTVIIDTRVADPDEVLAAAYPEAVAPPPSRPRSRPSRSGRPRTSRRRGLRQHHDPPGIDGEPLLATAMATWNAVPGQSFRFASGGPVGLDTPTCIPNPSDGVNTVLFSAELAPAVLGETCTFFSGSVDGMHRIVEFDLHLSSTTSWSTAPVTPDDAFDLETTILHELGHALGLDHAAQGTVMQEFLFGGMQFRALTADDIAGMQFLYGTGETPTLTPSPTESPTAGSTPTPTPTSSPTASPTSMPTPGPAYRATLGSVARD
jgi:hypothetical protein